MPFFQKNWHWISVESWWGFNNLCDRFACHLLLFHLHAFFRLFLTCRRKSNRWVSTNSIFSLLRIIIKLKWSNGVKFDQNRPKNPECRHHRLHRYHLSLFHSSKRFYSNQFSMRKVEPVECWLLRSSKTIYSSRWCWLADVWSTMKKSLWRTRLVLLSQLNTRSYISHLLDAESDRFWQNNRVWWRLQRSGRGLLLSRNYTRYNYVKSNSHCLV